jgi:hypothetical protein
MMCIRGRIFFPKDAAVVKGWLHILQSSLEAGTSGATELSSHTSRLLARAVRVTDADQETLEDIGPVPGLQVSAIIWPTCRF